MKPLRLAALCHSLRPASLNRMALALVDELLPPDGKLDWIDGRGIPFYDEEIEAAGFPPAVRLVAGRIARADGLVIASAEYNHSLPAALKNVLDWLSRVPGEPLSGKPVMILSASPGMLGGARMQYELRRVLDAVGAVPLVRPEVFIAQARQKFDAQTGACIDSRTREVVALQLAAFTVFAKRRADVGLDSNQAGEGQPSDEPAFPSPP